MWKNYSLGVRTRGSTKAASDSSEAKRFKMRHSHVRAHAFDSSLLIRDPSVCFDEPLVASVLYKLACVYSISPWNFQNLRSQVHKLLLADGGASTVACCPMVVALRKLEAESNMWRLRHLRR
jgi:hypothetical protein